MELSAEAFTSPYRDPIFDGPTDPILVHGPDDDTWTLLYTQRRATLQLRGTAWVHGTAIGSARSLDGGRTWSYRGTLEGLTGNDLIGRAQTLWAPDVVRIDDVWVMFLSVVEGVFEDWSGHAGIHQYESHDLQEWTWTGRVPLDSERVIDASVARTPDGRYRLWYKDERQEATTFVAVSDDPRRASSWVVEGQAVGGRAHEGPKVFPLGGWWWMIVDEWRGLAVHRSPDGISGWTRQTEADGLIASVASRSGKRSYPANHADVVPLPDGRALLVYFAHRPDPVTRSDHRSDIAATVLTVHGDRLRCALD